MRIDRIERETEKAVNEFDSLCQSIAELTTELRRADLENPHDGEETFDTIREVASSVTELFVVAGRARELAAMAELGE